METICLTPTALPVEDRLHIAVAAYLARYTDLSHKHAATDIRAFIS